MPALESQHLEDFAQAVAKGSKVGKAYAIHHPEASTKTCSENGSKLAKSAKVAPRIAEIKALFAKATAKVDQGAATKAAKTLTGTLLTMAERRRVMAIIVRNPKAKPETKMKAAMNDARLAGELIDHQDLTTDGEALPSVMPSINLQLPQNFLGRRAQPHSDSN